MHVPKLLIAMELYSIHKQGLQGYNNAIYYFQEKVAQILHKSSDAAPISLKLQLVSMLINLSKQNSLKPQIMTTPLAQALYFTLRVSLLIIMVTYIYFCTFLICLYGTYVRFRRSTSICFHNLEDSVTFWNILNHSRTKTFWNVLKNSIAFGSVSATSELDSQLLN